MTISTNGITKFLVITAIGSMLIGSGVAYGFEIFKGEDAQIRGLGTSQVVKLKTFGPSDGLSPGDTVLSFKATKSTTTSIVNTRGAIYDSSNNLLGSSNIITLPPSGSGVVEFTMTTPVTVPPNGIVQVMMNNDRVIRWNGGGIGAIVFDEETFPTIPDPWKQSTELGNNGIRCTGCSIDITLVVADAPPDPTIDVVIDIKPGSDPSSVNCKNLKGNVPLAIFGNENLDVIDIEIVSMNLVGLDPVQVFVVHDEFHIIDLNDDDFDDAVLHLDKAEVCTATATAPLKETVEVEVTGQTTDETQFIGIGDIRIVKR